MAQLEVYEVTNTSQQIVTFGYSTIDPNLALGVVDPREEGILKLVGGASTTIEAQRIELGELQEIQRKGLIRFEQRSVERADAPPPACFDLEDKTYFVGFPVSIMPENVIGDVEYWSAPELPAPLSLNPATGEITAPVPTAPYTVSFYTSAVGTNGLSCTQNYTLRVEEPDVIDFDLNVPGPFPGVPFYIEGSTLINFWVDWGDGSPFEYVDSAPLTHDFASAGTFNVRMLGELEVLDQSFLLFPFTSAINEVTSDSIRRLAFNSLFGFGTTLPATLTAPNLEDASNFLGDFFAGGPVGTIPSTLFDGCPNLRTVRQAFQQASLVVGAIPGNLFDNNPLLEDTSGVFSGGAWTGSIPANIFANNPNLVNAAATFSACGSLTGTIPSTIFDNNPLLENADQVFAQCTGLTGTIPSTLFDNNPNLRSVRSIFTSDTGLTGSIPATIFANNPQLEDTVFAFGLCTGLTGTIPSTLFDNNPNLREVTSVFQSCSGLTGAVPAALFANNPLLEEALSIISACPGITGAWPVGLLDNNPVLRSFSFGQDTAISGTIPGNFFDNNPLLEDISFFITRNTTVTGPIPATLFANNPRLRIVSAPWQQCTGLTGPLPPTLFDNNPLLADVTSLFLGVPAVVAGLTNALFDTNRRLETVGGLFNSVSFAPIPANLLGSQPFLTDVGSMFAGNGAITSIPAGIFDQCPNIDDIGGIFFFCTNAGFTTLPPGLFINNPLISEALDIFRATNLDAPTVDNFLIDLDTVNTATGMRQLRYDQMTSNAHLDAARSGPAAAAKANLITNGWVISGTY